MRRFFYTAFALILLLAGAVSVPAQAEDDKLIRLSSLEWPPYSGANLPGQGATIAVVRAALAAVGYSLEVTFYPWSRAVHVAEDPSSGFAGYFPEYHSEAVALSFRYSDPIGFGPLGFAQPTGAAITWKRLADLDRYVIGTVKDYVNTSEFDALVAGGILNVSEALNDTSNLMKVAYHRIDMAVIDENVLNYLVSHDSDLRMVADDLEFNSTLLENKSLYVCFNGANDHLTKVLNEGLALIDVNKIQREYFLALAQSEEDASQ